MAFEKAGKAWSAEEDKQLISEYNSGVKIDEICKIHMRNIGGISSRLIRLELIKDRKDIPGYTEYRVEQRNPKKEQTYIPPTNPTTVIEIKQVKEKPLRKNQIQYIELQENVKEIKKDIKELKQSMLELTEMLKAIYEFEDAE